MSDTIPLALADDFLMLEYEAHQNGNCNFCFFPESTERFRAKAQRLHDAIRERVKPEEFDDDDEAICLLSGMIEDNPRELPTSDDAQYQALRRVLIRLQILSASSGRE